MTVRLRLGTTRTLALALVVGLAAGVLTASGVLELLELKSLDVRFRLRGPEGPGSPIVIVTIDEDSFTELTRPWPFPRRWHAELLDRIARGRPAAIGLDILFPEPSTPADDQALAEAIALAGNVVLAAAPTETEGSVGVRETLSPPLPGLRAGAAAWGFANLPRDLDAFVRSAHLRGVFGESTRESFALSLYRVAMTAGVPAQPLPSAGIIGINFRGPRGTFPRVPYYQVARGEVDPEIFRDRIVLVGATTPLLHDEFPTPFSGADWMPGVEVQANALATLLQGRAIQRPPFASAVATAVLAAVVATLIAAAARPLLAFLPLLALVSLYAVLTHIAFTRTDTWIDLVPGPVGAGLGYGVTLFAVLVREQREKRRLSRFFSPDVVRAILAAGGEDALAGRRRRITVLFSDIRGFTTLSERLPPEAVVALLREYLTAATAIVFRHGGSVDKYVGDAIMALYGAPFAQEDHAVRAVRTALELQQCVETLSAQWVARGAGALRNGVGIHTGDAVVGAMGSEQRLEFTAIGDTVNVAARLEGLTKEFGVPVIISQTTYQEIVGLVPARPLGSVRIRGRDEPVEILAVETGEVRRAARVKLDAKVTIEEEDVIVEAALLDISRTGVAVTPPPRPIGDRIVRLTIELPGLDRPLETDGRVAARREDRIGLAFVGLPDEEVARLDALLARHGAPARESPAR